MEGQPPVSPKRPLQKLFQSAGDGDRLTDCGIALLFQHIGAFDDGCTRVVEAVEERLQKSIDRLVLDLPIDSPSPNSGSSYLYLHHLPRIAER
jgi:hypothetical protein